MIKSVVLRRIVFSGLFFVTFNYLAGCASGPSQSTGSSVVSPPDQNAIIVPPPAKPAYLHNAAIKNLLDKSDSLVEKQRYDSAVQELERGLSFAPNNPVIWQKLAEIRLRQGLYGQAEQLAKKSNALSQGDDTLRLKNWQIIAESKKSQQ